MSAPSDLERRQFIAATFAAGGAALAPGAAAAQSAASVVREERLHGRRALVLQNNSMRVGVLPGGGFIGEISLKSSDPKVSVNPMRVPLYQTIDPYTYDIKKHGDLYGTGIQRRLMSGYMGHFTCFPQFAASSPAELAQDYGQHGEAIAVEWKRRTAAANTLLMSANLTKTQYGFQREITMLPDETVAYVTETAENMVPYDRPYQWNQHVTFGAPFVAIGKMFADISAQNVMVGRGPTATLGPYPIGVDAQGNPRDYRAFAGSGAPLLMQNATPKNYCTVYSSDFNVLLGYIFDAPSNRWLLDYQEHLRVQEKPWDGKVIMRGLCWGNSITGGIRNAVAQGSNFGAPTFGWIDARGKISQKYAIFATQIPTGFKGVASVRTDGGVIAVTERDTGNVISVKSAAMW